MLLLLRKRLFSEQLDSNVTTDTSLLVATNTYRHRTVDIWSCGVP
jgi:hypothetical protein